MSWYRTRVVLAAEEGGEVLGECASVHESTLSLVFEASWDARIRALVRERVRGTAGSLRARARATGAAERLPSGLLVRAAVRKSTSSEWPSRMKSDQLGVE